MKLPARFTDWRIFLFAGGIGVETLVAGLLRQIVADDLFAAVLDQ